MANIHEIAGFLWEIANKVLRDDFKRGKYPDVILPFVVLRRLDCALEPTKAKVLDKLKDLQSKGIENKDRQLRRVTGYAFYNTSRYDFSTLLDDPKNIAKNLRNYINNFSENVRDIIDNFNLQNTISQLEQKNLLFPLMKLFADPKADLHSDNLTNHDMGYVFEELIRKFNEQTNENPGEHFTPREVIRLMARLVLNGDKDILKQQAVVRTIYDPACGTGGMLSVAKDYIRKEINQNAEIHLYGQEVNPETYAVCKSDLLIKGDDRDAENIRQGSTLSDDKHIGTTFDYQICNPPYGKEWSKDKDAVHREFKSATGGRFAGGLPRSSDGQMLFLEHMVSKMRPADQGGGRVAIVMNGSPLFTGDAGSGESNIRRWILENDWLEAIIALPGQLFYNTGINTYIWVLTNRKSKNRRGKVLLVNGAATVKNGEDETEVFARKMRKSLGDKRNELAPEHIDRLAQLTIDFKETEYSKLFNTTDFAYRKVTVERPLRQNFQTSPERIRMLYSQAAFINLAVSKKKDAKQKAADEEAGRKLQQAILDVLSGMDSVKLYKDRRVFQKDLDNALKGADLKITKGIEKAILAALGQRDQTAEICYDDDGHPEPDAELRDYEYIPYHQDINDYFAKEVTPHVPDAWINEAVCDEKDGKIGKVGYEINLNRYFYVYQPPRPLPEIDADIKGLENEILNLLKEVTV